MRTVIRNSYTPKVGDYCNKIVIDESTGAKYIFDCDGIYTKFSDGGTSNYEVLTNKPSINGHELIGNKTAEELGITSEPLYVYGKSNPPTTYIYRDRERTDPITAGEVLAAYESGVRVVFVSILPEQPTPGVSYSAVYNEVTRVYEGRVGDEGNPPSNIFFIINNARVGTNSVLGKQTLLAATSPSATTLTATTFIAQRELTAGEGITISGDVISATGGGGATMFYADLQNVHMNLEIYTDASRTGNVDSAAMIAALSNGPVMIKDVNDNNIYVTVVSANGSSSPVSIVIDMYDNMGDPARRRFEYSGPEWTENPFN